MFFRGGRRPDFQQLRLSVRRGTPLLFPIIAFEEYQVFIHYNGKAKPGQVAICINFSVFPGPSVQVVQKSAFYAQNNLPHKEEGL